MEGATSSSGSTTTQVNNGLYSAERKADLNRCLNLTIAQGNVDGLRLMLQRVHWDELGVRIVDVIDRVNTSDDQVFQFEATKVILHHTCSSDSKN